ncbi:MAG: type II toxin-antitoxin system PemK/MazF family toxin [Pseudanabaena sp.]
MTALQKGDVVLALFPFTDLSQTKLRPAIVLWVSATNQDTTICFISSQDVNQVSIDEFVLQPSDSEFISTGLKVVSKVRVTKIVTLERKLIPRRLGKLQNSYIAKLNQTMIDAFQLDSASPSI